MFKIFVKLHNAEGFLKLSQISLMILMFLLYKIFLIKYYIHIFVKTQLCFIILNEFTFRRTELKT